MSKSKTITWLSESAAADLLGLKPMTLRKKVKYGMLTGIRYFKTYTRGYEYCKEDIEQFKIEHSIAA